MSSDAHPDGEQAADEAAADALTPPAASDVLGQALGGAARRAGFDPQQDATTGEVVWRAIGGPRGIAESLLPTLLFVVSYIVSGNNLILAIALSVGAAVVLTVIRLAARQPFGSAVGGLIGALIAAGWALVTGSAVDAFLWGLVLNAVYGGGLLLSALVGWPIIGLAAGFLMGEGVAWRRDRRKRRAYFWLTIMWAALFAVRLAVQLPYYFSGDVAGLGTWKLLLGIPPFAVLVAVTWIVVRRVNPRRAVSDSGAEA